MVTVGLPKAPARRKLKSELKEHSATSSEAAARMADEVNAKLGRPLQKLKQRTRLNTDTLNGPEPKERAVKR
ncbi:hypothetical protein OH492_08395 [Vibrio chagasii]|nr:hypothetical protein [Vibrio chagasii]